MQFSKTFGFAISDHPVEEIQHMMLVFGIPGGSQPINDNRNHGKPYSCGNAEREICGVGEERASDGQTKVGHVESWAECSVEVCGDTGVNAFIEVDLILMDLSNLLFFPEDFQSEELSVIEFRIW